MNPIIPTFNAFGAATVTVKATMGLCNAVETFTIAAQDIVAPKFANCPTTPVMEMADPNTCASKVNWAAPVATDNCGMVNTIQTGGPASGTAIPVGSHTIVYTTSDMAGNTATCSFQVMVMDGQAPNAVCKNISVTLGQNGTVTIQASQLNGGSTDNCPGSLTYTASQTTFTTANVGTTMVTLTVTDAGGNTSTCNAFVDIPTYCAESGNEFALWNQPEFFDALHETQNLSESTSELNWELPYYCPQGNQYVRYRLFLDLDSDGTPETVVSNFLATEAGMVRFGNAATPNFAGGNLVAFDSRDVSADQKYRFGLEVEDTGTKYIAKVRWTTQADPTTYLVVRPPLGKHRIEWSMLDVCEDKFEVTKPVELIDCNKPRVTCAGKLTVNIGRNGKAYAMADQVLRAAYDNCTPFEQLAISMRKGTAGTTLPLTTAGDPVQKLTFTCSELGVNPVQLWVGDRSGNVEYCVMNVTVKDPFDQCLPAATGNGTDRQDAQTPDSEGDAFRLLQNQPNPFSEETVIGFYLPEASAATLTVFDESGRMLYTAQGDYAKGNNSVTVDKTMLGTASGILYYRITTDTDSATRKMILSN